MEALSPDRRLADRYVLEEPIATGGMASVWRARDEVLARIVAVKVLREDLAHDPGLSERFNREAVAAAHLTHPGIVGVFDTGMDDGVWFIVMEYAGDRTLADVLSERGAMEPEEAIGYLLPVLDALGHSHEHGLVHRDVKPANILVSDDGRVRVTDFGIAKAAFAGHDLTTTGRVLGTVRYLSPEQVRGEEVDTRSDLYSAGVILYELLTGRPPFRAETDLGTAMMRLSKDPEPPRNLRPAIPRRLEAVVLRAMARAPADRYQSAAQFRSALERLPGGSDTERMAPAAGARTPSRTASGTVGSFPLEEARPAHPPGRGASTIRAWMLVPLVLVLLAGAAIAGGLALGRLELGGPLGVRAAPGQTTPGSRLTTFRIQRAQDFDPEGDGSENPDDAHLAIDGDPTTAWTTDHYNSEEFGRLKEGLGLWLDLGRVVHVTRVTIRSSVRGWQFQLEAGSIPGHLSGALPASNGSTGFALDSGRTTVDLNGVDTSGILVWITRLGDDGGRFAAAIGEVSVAGTS